MQASLHPSGATATVQRVALVTGGARGIGLAIAERLGRGGAAIVLCDADEAAVEQSASKLRDQGMACAGVAMDVADPRSVEGAYARVEALHGRLDILVNNAGIQGLLDGRKPLVEEMPLDLWQRTLDVNLTGPFLMCRAAVPVMRRGRWGRIVNVSSRAARMRTGTGNANYPVSKLGLIALSRTLAGEVGSDGITVNCVAPSQVETDMTRGFANSAEMFEANARNSVLGRLATPGDIAASVGFLCSDDAAYITGAVLDVNGGAFMA